MRHLRNLVARTERVLWYFGAIRPESIEIVAAADIFCGRQVAAALQNVAKFRGANRIREIWRKLARPAGLVRISPHRYQSAGLLDTTERPASQLPIIRRVRSI